MKVNQRLKSNPQFTQHYKPKPYNFPDGFCVIIDNREQRPLFQNINKLRILNDTLKIGDYSIKGFQDEFCIERKMVSDFYSFIGRERKKTIKKLERMAVMDWSALAVEEDIESLLLPQMYSQVSPETARQFLVSVNVRYGIHVFCNRDREQIEKWCLDRMIKWYRLKREM